MLTLAVSAPIRPSPTNPMVLPASSVGIVVCHCGLAATVLLCASMMLRVTAWMSSQLISRKCHQSGMSIYLGIRRLGVRMTPSYTRAARGAGENGRSTHLCSTVLLPDAAVPTSKIPSSFAASESIPKFLIPVVVNSFKFGSDPSTSLGNFVRSRIVQITSNGSSRAMSVSRCARCVEGEAKGEKGSVSVKTVISAREVTEDQSAEESAMFW